MAEFNGSLLQFDSVVFDLNENPSHTTNHDCANVSKQHEFEPSKTETFCSYDLTTSDILQSPEASMNHIKMPQITNEITSTNDIFSQSDDDVKNECNVSTTLDPLTPCDNHNKSSEMLNEVNINHLHAFDNNIESSGVFNELESSEMLKEVNFNQLNAYDNHIESSEVVNEIKTNNAFSLQTGENPAANQSSDSGIHDWENNIVENTNVADFADLNISNDLGAMITDFRNEVNDQQMKDEEFHDAVQFFKDPSSFSCLENAGSSNAPADPLLSRSSLYVNFDPLHAKFFSQSTKSNNLHGIAEDDTDVFSPAPPNSPHNNISDIVNKPEVLSDKLEGDCVPDVASKTNLLPDSPLKGNVPDLVNKHLNNVSPRHSLGNILISFDSPVTSKDSQCLKTETPSEPQKLYTEEEFQQALKIQELTVQETFLKNQHDLEIARSQKQQEMENKIQDQNRLCSTLHNILKEFVDVVIDLSDKNKFLQENLEEKEKENFKLQEDLKTSVEDLQSVESTFADFHKRYEQCKNMLKQYNQNEGNLKQQIENMKVQLEEKEEMYKVLQSRTQEMLDKANLEVATVKKAGDAQAAVLKAQLKKAELKISSLESDVKHVKIENSKLSGICDDLMAKVSEA